MENLNSKKINIFSDSEDNDKEIENTNIKQNNILKDNDDLTYGFEKALRKKQFEGEKGSILLKLQNSYANDSRFKLDSKFKNDIEYNKLPDSIKENNKKHIDNYNYEEISNEAQDEDIELEKKKNLSLLAELLPNSAFLDRKSMNKPTNKLVQKRFDPTLNLGIAAVDPIKVEKIKKEEKPKNIVKLEKGVKVFTDKDEMELYNKYYNEGKHVKA